MSCLFIGRQGLSFNPERAASAFLAEMREERKELERQFQPLTGFLAFLTCASISFLAARWTVSTPHGLPWPS